MSASISARNITLDVPTYLQRERRASGWSDIFLGAAFDPPRRRLARLLEDISFEVNEGDRLAILGRNGAGKSTLLRVLNGVYQPTSGLLTVAGSCQALLNMGLGFNSEATVRENIYLRGVAMGLKSAFLTAQVAHILEFAGLRDKANHRLHTLSSGQRIRLGFAISTSVQHDIMLMDEWVGAGDSEFMARAKERMQSRVGGSKIVVLASHSISLLNVICNRGIVLEAGRLVYAGDIGSALKAYHELMEGLRQQRQATASRQEERPVPVYGRVATLVARGDGFLIVEGWCVDGEGRFPESLVLELHGQQHLAGEVTRISRPDVMRQFGLVRDDCGFRAHFSLPGVSATTQLGGVRVLAGGPAGRTAEPLQIASGVFDQSKAVSPCVDTVKSAR